MSDKQRIHDRLISIYSMYPRKMGKSAGLKKAQSQFKTMEDLAKLEKAVSRYIKHLIKEGTEKQYILYFSTFMSQWEDWLEEDAGTVIKLRKKRDLSGLGFES